jgi:two-component system chemotaxis response regulator CheY
MGLKADMKILVVDDMATMRKIIKNMLGQIGFTNITQADDGSTAWPLIEKANNEGVPYEFILSDWNMPKMSGLDLLKKMRAIDEFKKTPFLMITAEAEQGNVVIAVKAGVSNFIVKPFSAQVLKEKIDKIFNS